MAQTQRLRLGPPAGAPGVVIYQDPRDNTNLTAEYGATAVYGITKRGPMGVAVPIRGKQAYQEMFGDLYNPNYHLFAKSDHLLPDWVDGFFNAGGGTATLLVTRLELDGKARKSELILNGRNGRPVMKLIAANEGRWGGAKVSRAASSIVAATSRTFTLVAPGVLAGEYNDGYATFSASNTKYVIVSNTAADPATGEAIFTVAAQFDLLQDGVSGPTELTGTASYVSKVALVGTVEFATQTNLTGTADITGLVVNGTGTLFTEELFVGASIYRGTEVRIVESITSDLTLTVTEPFSVNSTGSVLKTAGLTVTGTGTSFNTALSVGDTIFVTIAGQKQGRTIASIASATSLKLTSGFTAAVAPLSTAYAENLVVTGVTSAYVTELNVGDYIIDPYRSGRAIKVTAVTSATSFTLEEAFVQDFTAVALSKQSQIAAVKYESATATDGLAVTIGQGVRKPDTHFSMSIFFNGNQVLQLDDLSLEAGDPDYVVNKLLSANAGYDDGTTVYAKYVEAEVLWDSAYTTAQGSDVRPTVGNGSVVAISGQRIYTVADLAYDGISGTLVYPDIYNNPSSYLRANGAAAPLVLAGTVSSVGTVVTGIATTFTSSLVAGDYFYDPASKTARKIQQVNSDTSLVLVQAFATNLTAGTKASRSGWISVLSSSDLAGTTAIGAELLIVVPQYLTGGYDGDLVNLKSTYWTKYADLDFNHLETTAGGLGLGLVRVACPGVSSGDIQRAFATYCLQRAYEFRIEIPSYMSDVEADTFVRIDVGLIDSTTAAYPSYGYSADPDGGTNDRFTTVTGDIMGAEAAIAVTISGYQRTFAGVNATLSPRIKRMVYPINPAQEARLNSRGIQPIKIVGGNIVVFGIKAPSASEQYTFIHNSRIQKNLVRFFREALPILEQLFEPNDPNTVAQLVFILNKYAENEFSKGVFSRFLTFVEAVSIYDIASVASTTTESKLASLVRSENGKISINFGYIPSGLVELIEMFVSQDSVVTKFGSAVNTAF